MREEVLDRITYREYTIELVPDYDAPNPFTEDENAPILALQPQAEQHFGWSTDKDWAHRLDAALEQLLQHGVIRNLYGPNGALAVVNRWLKVCHGMRVVWPVSAYEHSGTMVYLGNGHHWADPGGWDSGWIGWLMVGPEQVTAWGTEDQAVLESNAKSAFNAFNAWVCNDVVGYRVLTPDRVVIDEVYGFYGSENFSEPDGWVLRECKDLIDVDIRHREVVHLVSNQ